MNSARNWSGETRHSPLGTDLEIGFEFYENIEAGIGTYFFDSLLADIDSLQLFADIHPRHGHLYRVKSKRFPFWIYYQIEN
jgi:hypothetical protein